MITKKLSFAFSLATIAVLTFGANLSSIQAEIIETKSIESIHPYINEGTFVIFGIEEVLTDSSLTLGSQPSREYIRAKSPEFSPQPSCDIHDDLTWLIANKVPHKTVEVITPKLIHDLQDRGIVVAAFTSHGRSQWYSTETPKVCLTTERILYSLNIDLGRSPPPILWVQMIGATYPKHYRNGIYYVNHMEKSDFLKNLILNNRYFPKNIVFVDENRETLESVETAMNEIGIPFTGIWYTRAKQSHVKFNPMVANLQLEHLLKDGTILDEATAKVLAKTFYAGVDADAYFLNILKTRYKKDLK